MMKKIKQNWKLLLFLLASAVVAGFLFSVGWLNERMLVALGIGSFITIILLIVMANSVIKKSTDSINQIYKAQQAKNEIKGD